MNGRTGWSGTTRCCPAPIVMGWPWAGGVKSEGMASEYHAAARADKRRARAPVLPGRVGRNAVLDADGKAGDESHNGLDSRCSRLIRAGHGRWPRGDRG